MCNSMANQAWGGRFLLFFFFFKCLIQFPLPLPISVTSCDCNNSLPMMRHIKSVKALLTPSPHCRFAKRQQHEKRRFCKREMANCLTLSTGGKKKITILHVCRVPIPTPSQGWPPLLAMLTCEEKAKQLLHCTSSSKRCFAELFGLIPLIYPPNIFALLG